MGIMLCGTVGGPFQVSVLLFAFMTYLNISVCVALTSVSSHLESCPLACFCGCPGREERRGELLHRARPGIWADSGGTAVGRTGPLEGKDWCAFTGRGSGRILSKQEEEAVQPHFAETPFAAPSPEAGLLLVLKL